MHHSRYPALFLTKIVELQEANVHAHSDYILGSTLRYSLVTSQVMQDANHRYDIMIRVID